MYKQITSTASFIRSKIQSEPEVGIILGTGLGKLAEKIEVETVLEYQDIPGFPVSTVEGHQGRLIFGKLGGKQVVAMQGRFHYYEGYTAQEVTFPVRVFKLIGIKYLFVSNASGGVNPQYKRGDLMVINDHINLIPNPLIGPNMKEFGDRFPNMAQPYDHKMIAMASQIAREKGLELQYGCYVGVTGPTFETPKEYQFYRVIGGDTVGMSTTPEVIVANHCRIPVFAISVITDMASDGAESTHDLVLDEGARAEARMTTVFEEMLRKL